MKGIFMPLSLLIALLSFSTAFSKEIPYTQDDRDRLIRVEEGLKAVSQRIDGVERSLNQRIDDLKNELKADIGEMRTFMLWGFGILFGGMDILIGFVIWDRRTALAPAITRTKRIEETKDKG